jgi:WD40-like Beta Propeller Repeat
MRLSGIVARAVALGICLAAIPAALAAGHAVVPELVTTGPGDTGQRSYASVIAASADGERAVFGSTEPMTSDDHFDGFDLFERVGRTTRLLSPLIDGQSRVVPGYGGEVEIGWARASPDASRIVFASSNHWTPDDQDSNLDIFALEAGHVERISQGPVGGNAETFPAGPTGFSHTQFRPPGTAVVSPDARRVVFTTAERLTEDDTDGTTDVYAREGDVTTKLSPGNFPGSARQDLEYPYMAAAGLAGWSKDTRRVVVGSWDPLTADDKDDKYDLFLADGATTVKLSPGDGPHDASLMALSDDGHTALILTEERLLPTDGDASADLYRVVVRGDIQLVSAGPDDAAYESYAFLGAPVYMTPDGRSVVFSSNRRHTPDDTDDQIDTFLWKPERLVKVGDGSFAGAATDASKVVVVLGDHITPGGQGLFEIDTRTGDVQRVAPLPTGEDVGNYGIVTPHGVVFVSPDASRVVFETDASLVDEDVDEKTDVYQWAGGVTTLLSLAPQGSTPAPARWVTGSVDGTVGYIRTQEQLTPDDRNGRFDDYRVRPPAPGVVVGKTPALSLVDRPSRLRLRSGRVRLGFEGVEFGDALHFLVSHTDRVTVRIDKVKAGKRVGARCLRPVKRLRHRRSCTRYVRVARRLRFAVRYGRYELIFGRHMRDARVRPGLYRVTLIPRDGRPVRIRLRLVR